eukprot:gene17997-24406_t
MNLLPGENSIVIVGGANQSGWNIDAIIAKAAGVPVVLDAGGIEGPIPDALLACLSVLSPNETELSRLTNMPTENLDQVKAAAEKLMDLGVESVLEARYAGDPKLRSRTVRKGQEPVRQEAIKTPKVEDTTGAGDCFTAAYAVAFLEGKTPTDALMFASAAGCICVQRKGAMPSMPSREEVMNLLSPQ